VTIRRRREEDLPELGRLLAEQQPGSAYPLEWPLPYPVRDFLVRPGELVSRVAARGATLLGHVSVLPPDEDVGPAFTAATGRGDLALVSVLFTAAGARGSGVGSLLLEDATTWIRQHRGLPVLDVVSTNARPIAFYRRHGWVEVGTARPSWLPADEPDVLLMAAPDP